MPAAGIGTKNIDRIFEYGTILVISFSVLSRKGTKIMKKHEILIFVLTAWILLTLLVDWFLTDWFYRPVFTGFMLAVPFLCLAGRDWYLHHRSS